MVGGTSVDFRSGIGYSFANSSQIRFDDVDQFLSRSGFLGRWVLVGIADVEPDVPVEYFRHQRIDGATARRDGMEDIRALRPLLDRALDGIDLPADSANAIE